MTPPQEEAEVDPRGAVDISPDERFGPADLLQLSIGRAIRYYRTLYDITGNDLARSAGISLGMLSRIENGTVSASLATLSALTEALGISISDIIGGCDVKRKALFQRKKHLSHGVHPIHMGESTSVKDINVDVYIIYMDGDDKIELPKIELKDICHLYCVSGRVIYENANMKYILSRGDSLMYRHADFHEIGDVMDAPCKVILSRYYKA